jgi:hypothetical protein
MESGRGPTNYYFLNSTISPHLACAFPPHLIPLPPCTSTLHVLVRWERDVSAWGGLYTIQAVAFDLLIAFSLLFPPHTRLQLYHHSSCNK